MTVEELKKYFKIPYDINKRNKIIEYIIINDIKLLYKFIDLENIKIISKNSNNYKENIINIKNIKPTTFILLICCNKYKIYNNFKNNNECYNYLINFLFPPDPRCQCINTTTLISGESLTDIDINKFIKLNGYGYDCDELLEYMIHIKLKNINPYNKFIKIYTNINELQLLLNHKNLNIELLKQYNALNELIKIEKKYIPLKLIKNLTSTNCGITVEIDDIFNDIGEYGFKMLNDNIDSWSEDSNVFTQSAILIENLREKLNNNDFYYDLYYYEINIKDILDTAHSNCIHGVGHNLMKIYMYWISQIKNFLKIPLKVEESMKDKYKNILELMDYNNFYNLKINKNYIIYKHFIFSSGITTNKLLIKSYDSVHDTFNGYELYSNSQNIYCNDKNLKQMFSLYKSHLFDKFLNNTEFYYSYKDYVLFINESVYDYDMKVFQLITKNNYDYKNNFKLNINYDYKNNLINIKCFENKNLLYEIK